MNVLTAFGDNFQPAGCFPVSFAFSPASSSANRISQGGRSVRSSDSPPARSVVISHLRLFFPIRCKSRSFGGGHAHVVPALGAQNSGQFAKGHFPGNRRLSV